MKRALLLGLLVIGCVLASRSQGARASVAQGICPPNQMLSGLCLNLNPAAQVFQHVVIIVQENRTLNNIYGGPSPFPGAVTTNYGLGPIPNPGATSSNQFVQFCSNNSGTTSNTPTVTCPNTPQPSDVLVNEFSWTGAATNPTAPPGWNIILKNQTISGCSTNSASYWKLVNGDSNVIPMTNALSTASPWANFVYEISGQAISGIVNAQANANTCGRTATLRAGASSTNASPILLTFANDDGTGSAISPPTLGGAAFNADYPVAAFQSGHIGAYSSNSYNVGGGVGNLNPSWGSTTDGIAQTIVIAPAVTATGQPQQVALQPVPMATTAPGPVSTGNYDLNHTHTAWKLDCQLTVTTCQMNGWYLGTSSNPNGGECTDGGISGQCLQCNPYCAYGYVPQTEDAPYWQLAYNYVLGDNLYQTNEGASYPAHLYLQTGASRIGPASPIYLANLPVSSGGAQQGGCNSVNNQNPSPTPIASTGSPPPGWDVTVNINTGVEGQAYSCMIGVGSLMANLDSSNISWKYYQDSGQSPGYWNANSIQPIYCPGATSYPCTPGPEANAKIISSACSQQALTDIQNGALPQVAWITPCSVNSDHATSTLDCIGVGTATPTGCGPAWVAQVVNAIGQSSYWNNTLILVTWDDWGGWVDQSPPVVRNKYELSFRVPLLVICAYCQQGVVDHTSYEFGSLLATVESIFNVPCVSGNTDCGANVINPSDFNFSGTPRPYATVSPALTVALDHYIVTASRDKFGHAREIDY
jgi:phospholipase C